MSFGFRISVIFVLFAVHSFSVFWTTMALVGRDRGGGGMLCFMRGTVWSCG